MGVCLSKDRNSAFEDEKFKKLRTEMVHEYLKNKQGFKSLQISDNTLDKSNDTTNNSFPTKKSRKSVRRSHRNKEIKQVEGITRMNTMPETTKGNPELMPSEIMMGYEPIFFEDSHTLIIQLMKPKPSPPISETSIMPVQADFKAMQHIQVQTEKLDESSIFIVKKAPRFSEIFKPEVLLHDQTMIIDSKKPQFITVMEKNLENVDLYNERSRFLDMSLSEPLQASELLHSNPATKGYETLNQSHEMNVNKPRFQALPDKQALNREIMNERERFLDMSMSVPHQLDVSYNMRPNFMTLGEKHQENLQLYGERAKLLEMSVTVPEHPDAKDYARFKCDDQLLYEEGAKSLDRSMSPSVRSSASAMDRPKFITSDEKRLENVFIINERNRYLDISVSVPQQPEMQNGSKYLAENRSFVVDKSQIYDGKEAHSIIGDTFQRSEIEDTENRSLAVEKSQIYEDKEAHSIIGATFQRSDIEDTENRSRAIDISTSKLHSAIEESKRSVNSALKPESAGSSSSSSSQTSEENPLEEVYSIRKTYSSKTEDSEYSLKPQTSPPLEEEGVFDELEYGYLKFTKELDGYASQAAGASPANEFTYYETYTYNQKDLESPIRPSINIKEYTDIKYQSPFERPSSHLIRAYERPIPRELVKLDIEGKLTLDDEVRLSQPGRLSFSPPFPSARYSPYRSP